MKHLWIVSVFLGVLLTACTQPSGSTAKKEGERKGKEDTATTSEKIKEAIKAEAAAFHKESKELLTMLEKQHEGWKAKAADASGALKEKLDAKLVELDKQKARVKEHLTKLEAAVAEEWKDAKKEAQKGVDELKEAYEKAKEHFK